jgi:hypothetical protein
MRRRGRHTLVVVVAVGVALIAPAWTAAPLVGRVAAVQAGSRPPAVGPLSVGTVNPRYFATPDGHPVYLTGSHTWFNLVDSGPRRPPVPFDYAAYLRFLVRHDHNFIRLWSEQLPAFRDPGGRTHYVWPLPWERPGPGLAQDGQPRFDLTKLDPAYFERLRARVISAGEQGVYVAVMLFQAWNVVMRPAEGGWGFHPFRRGNNVNGVEADADGNGVGVEFFTLASPEVVRLQEAYVRRVVQAVNDLDNVLYEIANETGPASTAWHYHMIDVVRQEQDRRGRRLPVGMTFQAIDPASTDEALYASAAEWISPGAVAYKSEPPPADGRKVLLPDTDHLWGIGGSVDWVWKSFARGLNPIFMDPYDQPRSDAWEPVRRAMGQTRRFARRLDLAAALPRPDLASSGYCLAKPGHQYLVYVPAATTRRVGLVQGTPRAEVTVDLTDVTGELTVEWLEPSGDTLRTDRPVPGGAKRRFTAPFVGEAILYLATGGPR